MIRPSDRRGLLAALGGAALALTVGAAASGACPIPNPVVTPPTTRLIAAERALRAGKPHEAIRLVLAEVPGVRRLGPAAVRKPGPTRSALWIAAIATVRLGGRAMPAAGGAAPGEAALRGNLDWATGILRALVLVERTPGVQSALGEALSLGRPAERAEALRLLRRLAEERRLQAPEGWAALARLLDEVGRAAEAVEARLECRERVLPAETELCGRTAGGR